MMQAGPLPSVTKKATGGAWTAALLIMASSAAGAAVRRAGALGWVSFWTVSVETLGWKLGWFKCLQVTCASLDQLPLGFLWIQAGS